MSFVPTLAQVLSERLGRSPEEMSILIREGLAEAERRRWQALTPDQRDTLHAELERARSVDKRPFPPELITTIPLTLLPLFVRRVGDDLATARTVWQESFAQYLELWDCLPQPRAVTN